MSHFTVGVILPVGGEETTKQYLDRILAPFDENMSVDPYPDKCYCIGRGSWTWASNKADALVGEYKALQLQESKDVHREVTHDYIQYHENYGKADPNCEDCHGSGVRMSTYNRNRKWDWWQIGGRWNGRLPNNSNYMRCGEILTNRRSQRPTLDPDLMERAYFRIEHEENLAQYEAVPEDLRDLWEPFSILTPDGQWHERGDMGWFAMVADKKDLHSWIKHVKAIYEQYAENTLVLLDCHI